MVLCLVLAGWGVWSGGSLFLLLFGSLGLGRALQDPPHSMPANKPPPQAAPAGRDRPSSPRHSPLLPPPRPASTVGGWGAAFTPKPLRCGQGSAAIPDTRTSEPRLGDSPRPRRSVTDPSKHSQPRSCVVIPPPQKKVKVFLTLVTNFLHSQPHRPPSHT